LHETSCEAFKISDGATWTNALRPLTSCFTDKAIVSIAFHPEQTPERLSANMKLENKL